MDVKFILEIKILKLANSTGTRSEGNWKQYLRKMLAGVNKESVRVFLKRPFEIHWLLTSLYEKMKPYLLLWGKLELELRRL